MKYLPCVLALLGLAATAGCDSPTSGGKQPSRIEAGTTVQGRLEPGAADEYELVEPGADFRVLLQARGTAADTLAAELVDDAGNAAVRVQSAGSDTSLAAQASPWVLAEPGKRWRIRVRGLRPDDGGEYSLLVFRRDPGPETVPAAVSTGQLVDGEALDVEGDVDEFALQGTAGQEWLIFAASRSLVQVELVDRGSGGTVAETTTHSREPGVEQNSSGRVLLPRTGAYTLRVSTWLSHRGRNPYRLRVDAVNRAPESAGAALALGAVAEEAIGSVGDVDEFTLSAPAGQEINLFLQLRSGMSGGLTLELLRAGQRVSRLEAATPTASLDELGTGRMTLEGGAYTVRVQGPALGSAAAATGSYRFEAYPVDRRAEAGGQLAVGGPRVEGAIDRPGDVDEFTVSGTAGQRVVIHVSGTPARGPFTAMLVDPAGAPVYNEARVDGAGPGGAARALLRTTGTYRVRVAGAHPQSTAVGPYALRVYAVSPAPEHVSGTVQVGQTITGERIDGWGDLDAFTLAGDAGREVALFVGAPPEAPVVASFQPTGDDGFLYDYTFSGTLSLDGASTGRIRLRDGPYTILVDPLLVRSLHSGPYSEGGGAYALRVFPIDRLPEGRPAAYTLGDTVAGEPLYPAVDIDEYTFEVRASTHVRVFWSGTVLGILYPEGSSREVWNSIVTSNGELVREVTLSPGRYRLRVYDMALDGPSRVQDRFTRPYSFALVP